MPRFKLIVLPDGRCILASEGSLSDDDTKKVNDLWTAAQKDSRDLVVLPDCEVVVVKR